MSMLHTRINELSELIQGEGCEEQCNKYRDERLERMKSYLTENNIQDIIGLVTSGCIGELRAWLEPMFEHDYEKMDEVSLEALYRSVSAN